MRFAIIGGGVVGRCYAAALIQAGHSLTGVWDIHPVAELEALTTRAGAGIHPDAGDWLGAVDTVVSAVFGTAALNVAQRALPYMRPGSMYVDMTTAAPDDMVRGAAEAEQRGVAFVDVAITGAVNLRGAHTPLLCAGSHAATLAELFSEIGAPIKVVGAHPGDAAHLKLLRSVFAKGLEALTIECLMTAEVAGLREALHDVLSDIDQTPLRSVMESMVSTHVEHAERRRNEVIEARHLVQASGMHPLVLEGVQALFERTMKALELRPPPERQFDESLQWLIESARTRSQPSPGSHDKHSTPGDNK